jgi:hypothetical protein
MVRGGNRFALITGATKYHVAAMYKFNNKPTVETLADVSHMVSYSSKVYTLTGQGLIQFRMVSSLVGGRKGSGQVISAAPKPTPGLVHGTSICCPFRSVYVELTTGNKASLDVFTAESMECGGVSGPVPLKQGSGFQYVCLRTYRE